MCEPYFLLLLGKISKKPCEKRALDTQQSNRELDPLSSFPLFLMEKPLAKSSSSSKVGRFLTKNTDPHLYILWFCFVERGVDSYRGATDSQCHFFFCAMRGLGRRGMRREHQNNPTKSGMCSSSSSDKSHKQTIALYFLTSLYRGELEGSVVPSAKSSNSLGSWDCSVFCYSLHL